jgi:transcriptional regulator with XRE-family HTH domain
MEMTAEKKLAERIKYYRELRGMTQKDLAERMSRNSARHCHWTTISRWEAGKGLFNITLKKFRLLCAELGVNASKMMKGIR